MKASSDEKELGGTLNHTLKAFQGLLKGRSFPGKVLLSRKPDFVSSRFIGSTSTSEKLDVNNDALMGQVNTPANNEKECDDIVVTSQSAIGIPSRSPSSKNRSQALSAMNSLIHFGGRSTDNARTVKFEKELFAPTVDLDALRNLAWNGVPPNLRPVVWRLLLGYAPQNADRREMVLHRKRQEYIECLSEYYDTPDEERTEEEIHTLRQIMLDCPRTVPDVPFFQQPLIQASLEHILYIWAIRHPASGYVQGINDLVTPFLLVFLSEHLDGEMENWNLSNLKEDKLANVEADCYWCLSKLLDGIQDHYTFAQPGIQRLVFRLQELVQRIDEPVSKHMERQGLEFLQFAFRWVNCLLIREIPFVLVARLWDTYLAEGDNFPDFLVYVCASFLLTWTEQVQKLEFQEIILFLQHLPTQGWAYEDLEMVLSQSFMWRVMFNRSPNHLSSG